MNISEEPDVGKLQVRFREGYSKSLTLVNRNLLTKGRDLHMSTRQKILLMFLCLVLLLSGSDYPAFAEGEGNMDSGGSGMGNGSSDSHWNSGNDGVRVTVIRASNGTAVSTPFDFSNKTFSSSIVHFGKVSKLQYRSGQSLSPSGADYTSRTPQVAIPCIVSADGSSTIEAVKRDRKSVV